MERLGVSFSGGFQPPDIVDCVQLADELGYESAWMAEGHGGDQFSILTACALRTKNILLGTGITSVFVRSAPTIAMAAASVDHFSQGRFVLGLGTSHKVQVEPEHGLMFEKPIPRLRECVGIIRELLRKGEVSHRGDVYNIDNFDFWFEPLRREIPIYVAAVFPKMLEICGEIAQGALMTWCTLEHAEMAATHVAEGAKRAGRSPEDVEVATSLSCAVGSLGEGAMEGLRTNIAKYAAQFPRYRKLMEQAGFTEELKAIRQLWKEGDEEEARRLIPMELIDKIALVGSADQCRRKLDEYRRAGITQPIISPRVSGDNPKEEAMQIIRACAPR